MLAVGRVHTLHKRAQLTRSPGAPPSGFGRSVRALCIGITVSIHAAIQRPWSLIVTKVDQVLSKAQRGPGTVMLAVGRVHTLYMRSQLTRSPGAPPSGFGRSVRALCIGITVNPRRHPKAVVWSLIVTKVDQVRQSHGPRTVMLAVGRVHTLYTCGANSLEYLEHHPVALGEAYAHRVCVGTVNPHRQPKAPRGASLSPR